MDKNNNDTNNNNNNNNISHDTSATTTSVATTATDHTDQLLRHLNKLSHKISKPTLPPSNLAGSSNFKKPPLEPPLHPSQPPVYNINKSQFRDVVQKLTGSPAHSAAPPSQPQPQPQPQPPPVHAPKTASSRLQRIRPPPLVQLTTRPPLLNSAVNPLSPLPPLPTCHAAAESPISAYMRFLHSSVTLGSVLQPSQAPAADAMVEVSPFVYFPSPKSPCPLLSPNLVLSPTGNSAQGFTQLPVSPTVTGVPSPKWRDL